MFKKKKQNQEFVINEEGVIEPTEKPKSFYETYKKEIWLVGLGVGAGILYANYTNNKKNELESRHRINYGINDKDAGVLFVAHDDLDDVKDLLSNKSISFLTDYDYGKD